MPFTATFLDLGYQAIALTVLRKNTLSRSNHFQQEVPGLRKKELEMLDLFFGGCVVSHEEIYCEQIGQFIIHFTLASTRACNKDNRFWVHSA